MALTVVTPPNPFVTLAEARAHLRLDATDAAEDAYVASLIATACASIDGPEGWLGRALGVQTLDLRTPWLDRDGITLPCPPVIEVLSVTNLDAEDQPVAWDPSLYAVDGDTVRGRSALLGIVASSRFDALHIRYRAGYAPKADGTSTVPAPIRHAVLLLVGHYFEQRMAVTPVGGMSELPMGVQHLLAPYRRWS